jgi:prolyl-tRNA editing enzyme YbaK/EbsC (Cys-tRNA(Pro) deacylase)
MSIEKVREYLKVWNRDRDIIEMDASTATVADAAAVLEVLPARIAKSISLKLNAETVEQPSLERGGQAMVLVTAGDMKLDNRKFKDFYGFKAKMLSPEEALEYTGHAVGGVCPFGLPAGVPVYLDISIKRFRTVYPACGSGNSAIELTPDELNEYAKNKAWVDVCKPVNAGGQGSP